MIVRRLPFLPLGAVSGVLLALPAAGQGLGAQGLSCPVFPPASVSFDITLAPLQRNDGLAIAQLTRLPGRTSGPAGSARGHVLGLTQARYGEQSQVSALFQRLPDGSYCASANVLTVSFGFQQRVVHVARELPPGSCIHGEVLAHEMRHVAVDEALLREFAPVIRQRLDEAVARLAPVRSRSQQQAMASVRRPLEAAMRTAMQEFGRERDRRQAQVDTVEEYARIRQVCNGEVAKYLPQPQVRRRA
ncbi:hypothetical protein [Azospirillum agricola]|uniref:hypothetical protein n=1 Tax=Azospirillum agricola TaxID=1720247 RepID=UPI000A1CB6CE|nr:hypothetical protein [Azospirillum agricola]